MTKFIVTFTADGYEDEAERIAAEKVFLQETLMDVGMGVSVQTLPEPEEPSKAGMIQNIRVNHRTIKARNQALEQALANALSALSEINGYNSIHNDLEAHLDEVAKWGLGWTEIRPQMDAGLKAMLYSND